MVWLSKREMAYYLVLKKKFDKSVFNLGEALDLLTLFGSKNVARKILKKLKSKGFLESIGAINYRVRDEEEVLARLLSNYIMQRLYRNLKSKGYAVSLSKVGQCNSLEIHSCDTAILSVLDVIEKLNISVKCVE